MGPAIVLGKAPQEAGGGDAAGCSATDVGHVGKRRLQLLLIVLLERHAPGGVEASLARIDEGLGERIVCTEEARVHGTECNHAGAGECGDVHHGRRLELLVDIGEGIAEDETAFGIGVENLDGLARHRLHDIAGSGGRATGHVFGRGDHADHIALEAHLRDGMHHPQYGGGARHVVLHFVHLGRWLERNATGVEGDALAHQHQGCILGGATVVLEHDELWRLNRALGHGQQRVHAELLHGRAVEHLGLEPELPGEGLGGVGQEGGGADVGRQVAEVFGELDAIGQGLGLGNDLGCIGGAKVAGQQHLHAAQ